MKTKLFAGILATALVAVSAPAFADESNDVVVNENTATVVNEVAVEAYTGENWAGGSFGGFGGRGGDIYNSGDDVEGSSTGMGGNGGHGNIGGFVQTGDASAEADVENLVNYNDTEIDRTSGEAEDGNARVRNTNYGDIANGAHVLADTGLNEADVSFGGEGGRGGDLANGGGVGINDEGEEEYYGDDVEDTTTGNGGQGGDAAPGGEVVTGASMTRARVINTINKNVTRIMR